MRIRVTILLWFLLLISIVSLGQKYFTRKPDFFYPSRKPLTVSSYFADIRATQFHAGIDIRLPEWSNLHSIDDGFVSRIRISPSAYGKALYIDHPDGYTSVYGHMIAYNDRIQEWIQNYQVKNKTCNFDINLSPDDLPICKGEVIGYCGNTGFSFGPHLHFEVRDTKSEHIINPLIFFDVEDNMAPEILRLYAFPIDGKSKVNSKNSRQSWDLLSKKKKGVTGNQTLKEPVVVTGKVGFGIEAYDYNNRAGSRVNVYSIEVMLDTIKIYNCTFNEYSFDERRYVYSYTDYIDFISKGRVIQKCFAMPNNKFPCYHDLVNNGIIEYAGSTPRKVTIIVKDIKGNSSSISFNIVGKPADALQADNSQGHVKVMPYDEVNYFIRDDIKISFPEDALFDTLYFEYKKVNAGNKYLSPVHYIHNRQIPLYKRIIISLNAEHLSDYLKQKAVVAKVGAYGVISCLGGILTENYVSAESADFGSFALVPDTIAPKLKPLNFSEDDNLQNVNLLKFKIWDELSGVKDYQCFIDGEFVVFEYDLKNDLLSGKLPAILNVGDYHNLEIYMVDEKGNTRYQSYCFYK